MELEVLKSLFGDAISQISMNRGQAVVLVQSARLHHVLKACKDDPRLQFDLLLDVVAVDFLGQRPRFEVVYILYSVPLNHRLRVKVRVEEGEDLPTACDLWASADWAEREVWDMFGIKFEGHPNLKRILLFEGFEGHPLRKDYPTERRQKIPVIEEIP